MLIIQRKTNGEGSKAIRKVVFLERTPTGEFARGKIYEDRPKKKKVARVLRPLEQRMRRVAKARVCFAETYLDRHRRSGEKRRNGFIRDLWWNVLRARTKAVKVLRT